MTSFAMSYGIIKLRKPAHVLSILFNLFLLTVLRQLGAK